MHDVSYSEELRGGKRKTLREVKLTIVSGTIYGALFLIRNDIKNCFSVTIRGFKFRRMKATGVPRPGMESKILAIQRLVARMFGLGIEELSTGCRERVVTIPRQIAMYMAKHETEASLVEIGNLFGRVHHTTVMHAIAKITDLRRTDSTTDLAIKILQNSLKSGQLPSVKPGPS